MHVVPVPVRKDNYAYLLVDKRSNQAVAVDPFDVRKIKTEAERLNVEVVANLTTHHHHDHCGGNKDFASAFPHAPIYGGSDRILALTDLVKDNSKLTIGDNIHIKCLATPCHTKDSISYYATDSSDPSQPGIVFTGDTLFIAGTGRFFEGNGADMHAALSYLATLPDNTVVYNGHEYTAENLAFAKSVDPENEALRRLETIVNENEVTTGLSTIGDEKEWNVFMRLHSDAIRKATGESSESAIMDALRELKNNLDK